MASLSSSAQNRWCIFTSAGDYHNVLAWGPGNPQKKWDLIVAFYGDDEHEFEKLESVSTKVVRSKASKFQNLKKLLLAQPSIFEKYDFIFVTDDDLHITSDQIDRLFEIASRYDFWVSQPSFGHEGRVSHPSTNKLGSQIRLTNFVEVTCPLFRTDKLVEFMGVYDGTLVGWGIDWWFSNYFHADQNRTFAIIDEVVVLNPHEHQRPGGIREIEKLQANEIRKSHWEQKAEELGISEYEIRTLGYVIDGQTEDRGNRGNSSVSLAQIVYSEFEQERLARLDAQKQSDNRHNILVHNIENISRQREDFVQRFEQLAQQVQQLNQKVDDVSSRQLAVRDIAREVWFERQRRGLPYKISKWFKSRSEAPLRAMKARFLAVYRNMTRFTGSPQLDDKYHPTRGEEKL